MSGVNVDLLPCAFCGEMPRTHIFAGDIGGIQIDCMTPNCPASPITTGNALGDPLVAFTAWNRRPTPPAIDPKVTAIVEALRDLCEVTDAAIDPRYSTAEEWEWRTEALAKARAAIAAWEVQ